MTFSLFGRSTGDNAAGAAQIRTWVQETLQVPDDARVMVTELRCTEPGCPPLETVIAILCGGQQPEQQKLHKPMQEVTREDIATMFGGNDRFRC